MQPLSVPASLDSLPAVSAFVKAACAAAGLEKKAAYALQLAVVELVTNTMSYGFDGPAEQEKVHLIANVEATELRLVIEDAGKPFDPRQAPPPEDLHLPPEERKIGGLGVYLVLKSVDHLHYERVGNLNRTILTMKRPATGS